MDNRKALVVFSGGQDSTTCLFWALHRFEEVATVTFDYGQRHYAEINCARKIAKDHHVSFHVLDMNVINQLSENALTNKAIDITDGDEDELPSTYVPGRNHLFLSFAAIYAEQIGARHIVTGVSETDFSGYPDCRDDFIKSLNVTLNLAMDSQLIIHTPLMWLTKADVWALSDEYNKLEYIKEHTLTCYEGIRGDGCGECPACMLRQKGLEQYLQQKQGDGKK